MAISLDISSLPPRLQPRKSHGFGVRVHGGVSLSLMDRAANVNLPSEKPSA